MKTITTRKLRGQDEGREREGKGFGKWIAENRTGWKEGKRTNWSGTVEGLPPCYAASHRLEHVRVGRYVHLQSRRDVSEREARNCAVFCEHASLLFLCYVIYSFN